MSTRISRRPILAALALQADLPEPRTIDFVEGDRTDTGRRLSIRFDRVSELHAWLPYFGIPAKAVSAQPYRHEAGPNIGKTSTLANAYRHDDEWRGWSVHLTALDPVGEPSPELALDDATREQLQAVADEPAASNPCPYAQSHTRDFCGYSTCRES